MYKLAFKSLNVSLLTHLPHVSKSEFLIINAAIFIYDPQQRSCFVSKGQETCYETMKHAETFKRKQIL